jgi:hypothetical protein
MCAVRYINKLPCPVPLYVSNPISASTHEATPVLTVGLDDEHICLSRLKGNFQTTSSDA